MNHILGIGNALVDIMTKLKDDQFLHDFNLPKGSMQLVDQAFIKNVTGSTENLEKQQSSGGSAANTIHGLARLGASTGFIGKVGNDRLGDFFHEDLKNSRIDPKLFRSQTDTGRAIALISPDSERTFATFLGAAVELSPEELSENLFDAYQYLHIEGYLIQNHALLKKSFELAKRQGMKVSLDLASYNVVEENLEFLKTFVRDYVDVLFANEEEAKAFTGKEPEAALEELAEICDIAVVKVGKEGSFVKKDSRRIKVDPIDAKPIDTTGAGDAYAAGFLYGLINDYPLDTCGYTGALLAGKVIEVIGAKMDESKWQEIFTLVEKT
jgi:sugar/nucleoside kinase (ribokinase family)